MVRFRFARIDKKQTSCCSLPSSHRHWRKNLSAKVNCRLISVGIAAFSLCRRASQFRIDMPYRFVRDKMAIAERRKRPSAGYAPINFHTVSCSRSKIRNPWDGLAFIAIHHCGSKGTVA